MKGMRSLLPEAVHLLNAVSGHNPIELELAFEISLLISPLDDIKGIVPLRRNHLSRLPPPDNAYPVPECGAQLI